MNAFLMLCLMISLACFSGCSSARLKRCSEPVKDDTLWTCAEHVDGPYYQCKQPKDLFRCQDAQ
jgi:hypothetical protein